MTQVVTALYDSYDSAVSAVSALEDAGIPYSDISIISNNADERYPRDDRTKTAADAGKGAGIGAAIGGVGGLLTGLGLMAIPGVGPVVAAGWLAATAAGAATGAVVGGAAGGLVGALTKEGMPERDAHFYAEGVRRGGTLVSARVDDTRAPAAREILQRYKAVDPAVRGAAYRESGWTSFDENAPAYTADQVAAERARYLPTDFDEVKALGRRGRSAGAPVEGGRAMFAVSTDLKWTLFCSIRHSLV